MTADQRGEGKRSTPHRPQPLENALGQQDFLHAQTIADQDHLQGLHRAVQELVLEDDILGEGIDGVQASLDELLGAQVDGLFQEAARGWEIGEETRGGRERERERERDRESDSETTRTNKE